MGSDIWHDLSTMGGTGRVGTVAMTWSVATDVGRERKVNEDSVLAAPPTFVVADGMGGHDAGDVASAMVVERFSRIGGTQHLSAEQVTVAIDEANEAIFRAGSMTTERSMGTTAVGLVLVENGPGHSWVVFNVGDSRVYRLFEGQFEMLSVDHSYVQELVDAGHLEPADARSHPHRNVVTRALGVDQQVQTDLWVRLPVPGERFLLCSDGLTGEVEDDEIARVLATEPVADRAVANLVQMALDGGGRDNVTVIVVDVDEVDGADVSTVITSPRDEATSEQPMVLARPEQPLEDLVPGAVAEVPEQLRADSPTGGEDPEDPDVATGGEADDELLIDDIPEWSGAVDGSVPQFEEAPSPASVRADAAPAEEEPVGRSAGDLPEEAEDPSP